MQMGSKLPQLQKLNLQVSVYRVHIHVLQYAVDTTKEVFSIKADEPLFNPFFSSKAVKIKQEITRLLIGVIETVGTLGHVRQAHLVRLSMVLIFEALCLYLFSFLRKGEINPFSHFHGFKNMGIEHIRILIHVTRSKL